MSDLIWLYALAGLVLSGGYALTEATYTIQAALKKRAPAPTEHERGGQA